MALTLAIQAPAMSTNITAGQTITCIAAVTNAGASSVTLQSLTTATDGAGSANLSQPDFLTPNVPVGVGNPVLLPSTTYYFPFRVVFHAPNTAGAFPQAPGGGANLNAAAYPIDSNFGLSLTSVSSDGTVATTTATIPVLSTTSPSPLAAGGALQLSYSLNLVNFLTSVA